VGVSRRLVNFQEWSVDLGPGYGQIRVTGSLLAGECAILVGGRLYRVPFCSDSMHQTIFPDSAIVLVF